MKNTIYPSKRKIYWNINLNGKLCKTCYLTLIYILARKSIKLATQYAPKNVFFICLTVKNNIQIQGHHPAYIVIYNTTNRKIKYQNSPILKVKYSATARNNNCWVTTPS